MIGTSPLPLPTTRYGILMGGWEGERAGAAPKQSLNRPRRYHDHALDGTLPQ